MWYRSIERLLGEERYSTPLDVWAVGCIMAELLAGEPLFKVRAWCAVCGVLAVCWRCGGARRREGGCLFERRGVELFAKVAVERQNAGGLQRPHANPDPLNAAKHTQTCKH